MDLPNTSGRSVPPLAAADAAAGIVPRFRDVVAAQPDALAVADERTELTYAELASAAAGVTTAVREALGTLVPAPAPGRPDTFASPEPVGMLFSHEVWAVAALLGVIASGHPVLVLDPRTPPARLRQFTERVGVRLVIADTAGEPTASELAGPAGRVVVPLRGVCASTLACLPTGPLWDSPPEPTRAAALAFTSGSTGVPKPVANDHRLLVRDAWNSSIATGCFDADDVIAHTLPLAFHAGLTTTVNGLMVGAAMRLFDARTRGIAPLPQWIAEHRATVMITSPAIARALLASGPDPTALAGLRSVTVAGEAAYSRDVAALRAVLPDACVVRNRYGSSETGLIAELAVPAGAELASGPLPVGFGVGETRLGLTGPGGSVVEAGGIGTITVTAPQVALGYWGLPEATARSFRDNGDGTTTYTTSDLGRFNPDGSLQIVGRADHSVKIRGYLVDPAEVDAVLFGLPSVREAVTVGLPREAGGTMRLVTYVVPTADRPSAASVRAELRAVLPGHMVPEAVVFLRTVPRTDRGKIDRAQLPPPPAIERGHDEYTGWEELVADIWGDVLELGERAGLRDDFFELGGDSLAAEALVTRIAAELDVSREVVTTSLLVQAPVLQDFAARLLQAAPRRPRGSLVPLQPRGSKLPLFLVAGGGGLGVAFVPWARRLGEDQPTWALQSPVMEGRGLPDRSVESLARRHLAAVRSVQPNGPYQLAGHSFGGIVAFEMAHQLAAAGQEVALLAVLDSFPPDPADHPPARPTPLVQRLRTWAGLTRASLRSTPGGDEHWRFFNASDDLGRRYRGRGPWPGRALVVLAQSEEKDRRSRWAPWLSGEWRQVEVSGSHTTMTRLPWSDEVADALAAALEEARIARGGVSPVTIHPLPAVGTGR